MTPTGLRDQRLRPRKTPRQARAHETRARILDSARGVFGARGYAAGTTNRIAAAAGMSVGSLYQYFPNKDAILVELVDEHVDDGARRVRAAVAEVLAAAEPDLPPLDVLVDTVAREMVAVHTADRRLHRVLFEEAPRPAELLARLGWLEDGLVSEVAGLLARHPEVRVADPLVAGRMVVVTIESLVHRVVTNERSGIADEQFRAELVRLVTGYLRGG